MEILLLLDTYKIFFEVMASCLLDAEGQADEQSALSPAVNLQSYQICARGELIGYVNLLGPDRL